MIPDAVLSAFVQAKGCQKATREIARVQEGLEEATEAARVATKAVERFGRVRGIAVLDVDAAKAKAATAAATKTVEAFNGKHAEATADLDIAAVVANARTATAAVNGVDGQHATATLDANGHGVTAGVAKATSEVRGFGALSAEARADVKIAGAAAKIQQLRAKLADLTAREQTIRVRVEAAKVVSELERAEAASRDLRRELSEMDAPTERARGGLLRLGDAGRRGGDGMVTLRGSLGPISGGLGVVAGAALFFGIALLSIVGPAVAVVAALGPLVGLAAGVAGGLVAAAQGFGVFKLATMGVLDALKEQNKVSQQAGQTALQQAGQEVAAARAIRGAQEGLRAAREGVSRAAQQVAEATRQERLAVAALGPAYREARERLRDLKDQMVASNLSLRDARVAANEARKALRDLLSGPSPRQLADAHRAVADAVRGERSAVQALADAHRDLNDLLRPADALDLADARDSVADSTRQEARAQHDLAQQIKATNAILADPGASETQKAEARMDLADAENAVQDAKRQSARAQEALSKLEAGPAQDELARARGRVEDAEAAVAAAKRDTLDAQTQLAKVESGASSEELAAARLALAHAEHGLSTATKDSVRAARAYADAEAAGLARSPSVIAAREALRSAAIAGANAERNLADAQRQETAAGRAVAEAQADTARSAAIAAGAAANLNEKMSALPGPAQAFVKQLQSMKPRLDALRETAAAGFFPGATAGLKAAEGSFGSVNKVVGQTAAVLGDAARKSGELVGSPSFGKDIETIGGRNAKVIGTLGEALRHVISAFRHVLVAAGPLTQWLADVANKWALNAAEAAKAGRESGKLAAFFERTREVAQRLGSILGHLAHGLFGVGKAGTTTGNDILESIDAAAKRFDAWANSVKGQNSIREFFEKTRELAAAFLPVLTGLGSAFAFLSLKLLPVTTALELLGPLTNEAVTAFVAWKLAITGVNLVMKLFAAQAAIAAFATGGWTAAFWRLNAAMSANVLGIVILAIAALVAGLIYAYKHSETFRNIVDGAFRAVASAAAWFWQALKDVFGWLSSNWPLVLAILTGPIGLAVLAISKHADEIVDFFTALPGRILDAIKAGASFIAGVATWLKDQLVNGIKSYVTFYVGLGSWLISQVVAGIKGTASFISGAATWIKDRVVSLIHGLASGFIGLGSWIINRIFQFTQAVNPIGFLSSIGDWIKNRVVGLVHAVPEALIGLGGWMINRIFEFATKASPIGFISEIGDWILNRIKGALNAVKDGIVGIGGTIIGWIVDGLKKGANLLVGFLNQIIGVINKIPGVEIPDIPRFKIDKDARGGIFALSGGSPGATEAFAHGGAYARTGGIVSSPITLMGEEAPCIAYGTLIETETGKRPIQDVTVGEFVRTRSGYREVLWSGVTRRNAAVVRVATVDGDNVLCTPDHRIWTASGDVDGNGSGNCLGCGALRGRGVLSVHGSTAGEQGSGGDAGHLHDGPGCTGEVRGGRRCGLGSGAEGPGAQSQADLHGRHSFTGGCPADHQGLPAVAWRAEDGEGPRTARSGGQARRGSDRPGDVLSAWTSADDREHLRQSQGLRHLPHVQTRPRAGVEQAQVRDQSGTCAAGTRRGSRERPQETCRPRMERAPQGTEASVLSPNACWREARDLAVGDWVWTLGVDGELHASRVESITPEARIDTYDLMVDDEHEFVAGGILVHNSHPEWVIPENPAYRSRALALWQQAGTQIGAFAKGGVVDTAREAVGYAEGGVINAFRKAVRQTDASQKPALALFEAGIVESGLRNLPYGHLDSLGALQVRAGIHGRDLAMDPFRSAMAFLTRGFTGMGGAIALAPIFPTAGRVAQAVQGSAYPEKYDLARDEALKYMKGGGDSGGILGAIGGAISSVGGALGDLLSKGVGWLLGKLPGVGDLPDWLKGTGNWVFGKARDFIKDKFSGLASAAGLGGDGGGGGDVKGLRPQVTAALSFAKSHGWGGRVNSGFRSYAEQQRLYEMYLNGTGNRAAPPGNSMHERGLAVDVSDAEAFARAMSQMGKGRLYRKVPGEPWHFSTTGYAKGGVYGPAMSMLREGGILGSYRDGTNWVPKTGPYMLHRGESVAPAGTSRAFDPQDIVEALRDVHLTVLVGDEPIAAKVKAVFDNRDRHDNGAWNAGIS